LAKDYYQKIIDPNNPLGDRIEAKIPGEVYMRHYKESYVKYLNLIAAKAVLENTLLIFEGVREFQEGGWCFIGRPESHYVRENVTAPLSHDQVFAVYLNPAMSVYEWRLEDAEESNSWYPMGHQNRYDRLVWKSTS